MGEESLAHVGADFVMRRAGGRVAISPLRVTTSARRWLAEGPLFATARNLALLAGYTLGVAPARLARFYPPRPIPPAHGPGPAGGS